MFQCNYTHTINNILYNAILFNYNSYIFLSKIYQVNYISFIIILSIIKILNTHLKHLFSFIFT